MGWVNWIGECTAEHTDQVEEHLFALGAVSVTFEDRLDQPIFEPAPGEVRLWALVKVKALFDDQHDVATIESVLKKTVDVKNVCIEQLPDKNWVREWMDQLTAQQFGERLWIVPSWLRPPDETGVVVVSLDPGVAFGTGTHATTAMCLNWLDGLDIDRKSVLDFGCGSGILAIAALKLGARQATAVDIDPQAIEATEENATKNDVVQHIRVGLPDVIQDEKFDIVIANILAGPLIELSAQLMCHLESKGFLVLSGLLVEQVENVKAAYSEITWVDQQTIEEWVCLIGRRKG